MAMRGLQLYRCRACNRTFNALACTPLARPPHKQQWLVYLDHMLDSCSIRCAASELDVASTTSFRWLPRFLNLRKQDHAERLPMIATEGNEISF